MTELAGATASALERIIAPIEAALFRSHYFEREPLHVQRTDRDFFVDLYGVADVEAALHLGAAETGRFAMTRDGAYVPANDLRIERTSPRARYSQRPPAEVLDPRAVATRYQLGHTLLINDATRFSPRLQTLCNRLQLELGAYVQANAYLTPPNERGFSLHHDTHDVLIVQIEGSKLWKVYDPVVELPIENQPLVVSDADARSARVREEIWLEAGSTLYLPRGYRHLCVAGSTRSLHLTLALLPVRVIELIDAALQLAATGDVELRRALPFGWQDQPDFAEAFAAFVAERARAIFSVDCMLGARRLVVNDLFAMTRPSAEGLLEQADLRDALQGESRIALRDDNPFLIRQRGEAIELLVAGKATTLPAACAPAIRALSDGARTVAELDRFLPGSGIALAKLLVTEGVATIVEEVAPSG